MTMPAYYDADRVEALLDLPGCIAAVRAAMIDLSTVAREQPLRQITGLGDGRVLAVMPGMLPSAESFGAKLISVFKDPDNPGRQRHRGLVVAFDDAGTVNCLADAEAVTSIRTACATAAATAALARTDARTLVIFGTGNQAMWHLRAVPLVRSFERVIVWGRSVDTARAFATRAAEALGFAIEVMADNEEAAATADVICTVTNALSPVLHGAWVRPGTHVNLVGSSHLGPIEADVALVARSRYFADYRPSVLAQAAEFDAARTAGEVDDSHIVAEIGEVFARTVPGRETPEQITLYKSLGHVVQDLASVAYVHARASA